jgi:high-affinity K+ transport system ATPase subunit B
MLETPTDDSTKAGKSKGASVSSPLSSPSVGSPVSGESAVAFPQEVIKIIMDTDLVVDDRFILPAGCIVPCDVVISGRAVVDENMLSGESMQVSKIP